MCAGWTDHFGSTVRRLDYLPRSRPRSEFCWLLHVAVMASELASLAADLEAAHRRIGEPMVVRFSPAEPNVGLEFAFNELGQIAGQYRFRGEGTGFEPELAGRFGADHTYLPEIVAQLRSLLAEAR